MSDFDIQLTYQDDGLFAAYQELAANASDFVDTITTRTINEDVAPVMLPDFQQEPGPAVHPIAWTSPKQRRYVMAMIRKGVIRSPYVRTHALSQSWKLMLVYDPNGIVSVVMVNTSSVVDFVEGNRQQGFHADTGWFYANDKAQEWVGIITDEMETALIKAFYAVEPLKL